MTEKEKFVITITLQKHGLKSQEIKRLIARFEKINKRYSVILKALERLTKYFIDEKKYDSESFTKMLTNYQVYRCSTDKIKRIEQIFEKHHYNEEEIKRIETLFGDIFSYGIDTLDNKLQFYSDIDLQQQIVDKPPNLQQSLSLSYARYEFLKDKINFRLNRQELFREEIHFITTYGVQNKNLIKTFPLPSQYKKTQNK